MDTKIETDREKILKTFEALEVELNLGDSLIAGVHWWDIVRYRLFQEILQRYQIGESAFLGKRRGQNVKRRSVSRLLKKFGCLLKLVGPRSPLWMRRKQVVILGHPRRKFEDNVYIDLYSDPLIDLFPDELQVSVLERPEGEGSRHLVPAKTIRLFYLDSFLSLSAFIASLVSLVPIDDDSKNTLRKIETAFNTSFDCDLRFYDHVIKAVYEFKARQTIFSCLFKMKMVKSVFIVVSPGNEAAISAAKGLGIPTVELQHGSPTRGKLNYDYTSGIRKRSFPDWFASFGPFWTKGFRLPVAEERVFHLGFPHLSKERAKYSGIKKEDLLVVISQPDVSDKLVKFSILLKEYLGSNVEIIFKPHPAEYYAGALLYENRLIACGVQVADKRENLYWLFARARWHLGVYSTAIYEGIAFRSYPFVLSALGAELMAEIVHVGAATFVRSPLDVDLNIVPDDLFVQEMFATPTQQRIELLLEKLGVC